MNTNEYFAFHTKIAGFFVALRSTLASAGVPVAAMAAPLDCAKARHVLPEIAQELMLARDVDKAIETLLSDQAKAIIAVQVAMNLDPAVARQATQRAYDKAPSKGETLPGMPAAYYLLEICSDLKTQ